MRLTGQTPLLATLLPKGAKNFLKRRATEAVGLGLMALSIAMFLAILSYDPTDTSLNVANSNHVSNLLGTVGAAFADLSYQTIGLPTILLSFVFGVWGWKFFQHIGIGRVLSKVVCLISSLVLLTATASAIKTSAAWPLPAGYGGAIGEIILKEIVSFINLHISPGKALITLFIGFFGIVFSRKII